MIAPMANTTRVAKSAQDVTNTSWNSLFALANHLPLVHSTFQKPPMVQS